MIVGKPPGLPRKEENVANISADITREQLEEWRKQKLSYQEMAEAAGVSTATIGNFLRKYNMVKGRLVPPEDKQRFINMRKAGISTQEIADSMGYVYSTVYRTLKEAGLIADRFPKIEENVENTSTEEDFLTPRILRYAVSRKPRLVRVTCGSRTYIDVTDLYIPS